MTAFTDMTETQRDTVRAWIDRHSWESDVAIDSDGTVGFTVANAGHIPDSDVVCMSTLRAWAGY